MSGCVPPEPGYRVFVFIFHTWSEAGVGCLIEDYCFDIFRQTPNIPIMRVLRLLSFVDRNASVDVVD